MNIYFYNRNDYADYMRLPSENEIKKELAMMYNNELFESEYFKIKIDRLYTLTTYYFPDEIIDFCKRIRISDDNVTLFDILFPINNFIGMETDDVNGGNVVLDETYLNYFDKAIRYIKLHDDMFYFEFNTDDKIINLNKNVNLDFLEMSEFYHNFKKYLEKIYDDVKVYANEFKYANVVASQCLI